MNQVIADCSQLRKLGNAYLAAADVIERASGATVAQPTGGKLPTTTAKRVMSEATKEKIRQAHLKRSKLNVHDGGKAKKAA